MSTFWSLCVSCDAYVIRYYEYVSCTLFQYELHAPPYRKASQVLRLRLTVPEAQVATLLSDLEDQW